MKEETKNKIMSKQIDRGFFTDDITELAEFINSNVKGVEVSVSQPCDVAEYHNLIVISE